jgi:hypothetical protein
MVAGAVAGQRNVDCSVVILAIPESGAGDRGRYVLMMALSRTLARASQCSRSSAEGCR